MNTILNFLIKNTYNHLTVGSTHHRQLKFVVGYTMNKFKMKNATLNACLIHKTNFT